MILNISTPIWSFIFTERHAFYMRHFPWNSATQIKKFAYFLGKDAVYCFDISDAHKSVHLGILKYCLLYIVKHVCSSGLFLEGLLKYKPTPPYSLTQISSRIYASRIYASRI